MTDRVDIGDATLITADVLDGLRSLPDESVHCVVTSPPYWGLRDYGTEGMIGLEPTLAEWLAKMVAVCGEVRRVLRDDGTFWLNVGDAYAANRGGTSMPAETLAGGVSGVGDDKSHRGRGNGYQAHRDPKGHGLKHKDLLQMPARLSLALQDDGWWVRSDIIWQKPNPMPESVTDRPTSAHEHIYLLTKAARYFWDADAVRECKGERTRRQKTFRGGCYTNNTSFDNNYDYSGHEPYSDDEPSLSGRNLRNVWTIATQPYPEAHFATFPEELPRKCIMAGTSERGVCEKCGSPWVRVVEKERGTDGRVELGARHDGGYALSRLDHRGKAPSGLEIHTKTLGWRPTCEHYPRVEEWREIPKRKRRTRDIIEGGEIVDDEVLSEEPLEVYQKRIAPIVALQGELCEFWEPFDTVPATVLDPFSGSGTTGLVALKLGRRYIGIELNPDYQALALKRIDREQAQGRLW